MTKSTRNTNNISHFCCYRKPTLYVRLRLLIFMTIKLLGWVGSDCVPLNRKQVCGYSVRFEPRSSLIMSKLKHGESRVKNIFN